MPVKTAFARAGQAAARYRFLLWLALLPFLLWIVARPFFGPPADPSFLTSPMKARGAIRDRHGEGLTEYIEKESASLDLVAARRWRDGNPEQWRRFAAAVSAALELPPEGMLYSPNRWGEFRYLRRWLTPEQSGRLREVLNGEWYLAHEAVRLKGEPATYFPWDGMLAPLLGFTDIDGAGAAGLQWRYDHMLAPKPRSAYWSFAPRKGIDLYLTIDIELQRSCEYLARDLVEKHGAATLEAVVLRASDGKTLAMVSLPSFDPNRFPEASHQHMRLRPVTDLFQVGPLLRPFLQAELMEWPGEEGLKPPGEPDREGVLRALSRFRLNRRAGVDFPGEAEPMVARMGQSREALHEFLQGYAVALPLHRLALSFCPLVNGGKLNEPGFVERLGMPDGEVRELPAPPSVKVLGEQTSQRMREALRTTAAQGESAAELGGVWASYQPRLHHSLPRPHHVTALLFAPARTPRVVVALKMTLPEGRPGPGQDLPLEMGRELVATALRHLEAAPAGGSHAQ